MTEKNLKINFWVGVFSLFIIIVSCTLIIFFLGKLNPFQSSITLRVNFTNVQGLKVGSSVNLNGLSVGRVVGIRLTVSEDGSRPMHQVSLIIADKEEYLRWITTDSKFEIVNDNLFGDKHIEVGFSSTGRQVRNGDLIVGAKTTSLNQVMANIQDITERAGEVVEKFTGPANGKGSTLASTFGEVRTTLSTLGQVAQSIREVMKDSPDMDLKTTLVNLNQTISNLQQVTKKANEMLGGGEGKDWKESLAKIQKSVENFESISTNLSNTLGGSKGQFLLLWMLNTVRDFSKTAKNLAELTSNLNKTFKVSNQQNVNLAETMKDLKVTAKNLRKISQSAVDVIEAPNRFYRNIFGGGKKKTPKKGKSSSEK